MHSITDLLLEQRYTNNLLEMIISQNIVIIGNLFRENHNISAIDDFNNQTQQTLQSLKETRDQL